MKYLKLFEDYSSMHNLEPWLKRRELYDEDEDSYYTIKWLK